jgi:hypothetical protein
MKTSWISFIIVLAVATTNFADDKGQLPGKAPWDLAAFSNLFKVADTQFDPQTNQVTWVLELKNEVRTSELVRELDDRVFQLSFIDDEGKELAVVQMRSAKFKGIPTTEKLTKRGTKLDLTITVPDVLEKTKQVRLSRVKGG